MGDLSVWDLASDFSGKEAAALIVGEMPSGDPSKWRPVIDRMRKAHQAADNWHTRLLVEQSDDGRVPPVSMLESIDMLSPEDRGDFVDSHDPHAFRIWPSDGGGQESDLPRFKREEIARWLDAIGHKSKYRFELKNDVASDLEKPLASRERASLLTIIAVLCKEAKIPYNNPSKAAGMIQSTAAGMGVSIGETTIEGYLKKIPDALGTRMK